MMMEASEPEPEPEPELYAEGLELAEGALEAAWRMGEDELTATKVKRGEREPWHADELAMRRVLLRRLAQREGWAAADIAALDSTLMLQAIRGFHHEVQRVETTYEKYAKILDWRRSVGADALLSEPPPETVRRHAEWRQQWHMDAYGEDSLGHPIMGHRLGKIDPTTFLDNFDIDLVKLCYARDMEYFAHRKRAVAQQRGEAVYKQVVILDMDGLSSGHFGSKFRGPVKDVIVLLQDMYPEGTHRIFIINTPAAFRAIWWTVQGYLDTNVRENIKIVNYDKQAQRKAFAAEGIELSQIPVWAGGEWLDDDGWLARHERAGTPAIPPPGKQEQEVCGDAEPCTVQAPAPVEQEPAGTAAIDSQLRTIPSRTEGTGSSTTDAAEVVNEVEKEQEQQEPRAWLLQRISQELEIPADSSRGVLGEAVHQLGLGEATNQGTDAQRLEAVCEFLDIDMMNAPGLISDRVQVPAAGAMSDVLEPVMPEPESEPPLQVTGDVGIRRSVLVAKEDGGDLPRTVVAAIRRELDIPPSVVACTTDEGLIAEAVRQLGLNVTGISSIQRKAAMIFEYLDLDIGQCWH